MPVADTFEACISFTRTEEGGYTCSAEDSGNWSTGMAGQGRLIGSNMGVSAPTLISWLGRDESAVNQETMRSLAEPTYQAIARARYWRSLGCDGLPPAVAMMVFDYGWNVGVGNSARLLQRILGLTGNAVDGDLGAKTLSIVSNPAWPTLFQGLGASAIKQLQSACGQDEDGIAGPETMSALSSRPNLWPLGLALKLEQEQVVAYQRLRNFATYGRGWLARTQRRLGAACQLLAE